MRKNGTAVFLVLLAGVLSADMAVSAAGPETTITISYDNTAAVETCGADWGFSCLIEGRGATILFDMGTKEELFLKNIAALGIDLGRVDLAVISHFHGDHIGGLGAALRKRPGLTVHVPVDPSPQAAAVVRRINEAGGKTVPAAEPVEIAKGVRLTGTMGTLIKEQSLMIETGRGRVIVTGCAHQGIVSILEKFREPGRWPIEAVLGGFHLMQTSEADVERIIARFRELGAARVGASHCTGEKAIAMFRKAYGNMFVELGAGRVLRFDD